MSTPLLEKTVETLQSVLPTPTMLDKLQASIDQYPSVPKAVIVPIAFLATLAGWSVMFWLAIHLIVALEVLTEWRVYHTKYKINAREWTMKITNKLIGYLAVALMASALSWVGVEIRAAAQADIPNWLFMLTPNAAGAWIILASTQVIRDNLKLLGVPLPGIILGKGN